MRVALVAFGFALLAMLVPASGSSRTRSLDYDFTYSVLGAGAGSAASPGGDYSVVGLLVSEGAVAGVVSSSSYSIEPVSGSGIASTAVADWVLY